MKICLDFPRVEGEAFARLPITATDATVMEQTNRGAVLPPEAIFSDVRSWGDLLETVEQDSVSNIELDYSEAHRLGGEDRRGGTAVKNPRGPTSPSAENIASPTPAKSPLDYPDHSARGGKAA
jgi:hypothetical protein